MRETFPHKRPGDRLTAKHVNMINQVARRTSARYSGSYHSGVSWSVEGIAPTPYFVEEIVQVVASLGNGLYRVRPRYYNHDPRDGDGTLYSAGGGISPYWATNEQAGPFLMDTSDTGTQTYTIGNNVVAFWQAQRSAFIPISVTGEQGTKPTGDEMWCAQICECAVHRDSPNNGIDENPTSDDEVRELNCCVFRGEVKRVLARDSSSNFTYCEPRRVQKPAWIIADCQEFEIRPKSGAPKPSGWVRLIEKNVTITWRPDTDAPFGEVDEDEYPTVTETLDLFEWCCWKQNFCPEENEPVTAKFRADNCPVLDGLEVNMDYRSGDRNGPPFDDLQCAYDGWVGEFKVPSATPIVLITAEFVLAANSNLANPPYESGWVRPNPITGQLNEIYINDNGDQRLISLDRVDISTLIILGDAEPLLNFSGTAAIEETVDRWYRIRLNCNALSQTPTEACIEHLYPPGHPVYKGGFINPIDGREEEPTEENMSQAISIGSDNAFNFEGIVPDICGNQSRGVFDMDFGSSHGFVDWWDPLNPNVTQGDGYFQGLQYIGHTFAGCYDGVNPDFTFNESPASKLVTVTFMW